MNLDERSINTVFFNLNIFVRNNLVGATTLEVNVGSHIPYGVIMFTKNILLNFSVNRTSTVLFTPANNILKDIVTKAICFRF